MDKNTVRISAERQITIRELSGSEFSEQILADLIAQGYSGEELLAKLRETQYKVRPAIEAMLDEAENVASDKGAYGTYEDVFGTEDSK